MANYYSHISLRNAPDKFRLTKTKQALLKLMDFTVHAGTTSEADFVYCDICARELTIEGVRVALNDNLAAVELAVNILANINSPGCEDGVDNRPFDYANLYQHALKTRGMSGFVQFSSSHTCDKARVDGFGGSALHVTAETIEHVGTDSWLRQMAEGAV